MPSIFQLPATHNTYYTNTTHGHCRPIFTQVKSFLINAAVYNGILNKCRLWSYASSCVLFSTSDFNWNNKWLQSLLLKIQTLFTISTELKTVSTGSTIVIWFIYYQLLQVANCIFSRHSLTAEQVKSFYVPQAFLQPGPWTVTKCVFIAYMPCVFSFLLKHKAKNLKYKFLPHWTAPGPSVV